MLKITRRMGIPEKKYLNTDRLEECFDKDHFLSYTKDISYKFNSRGFRDQEWPEDLSDVIWCVGDSATVGIGQPFEEVWPQLLQQKLGRRCINVGEEACSNDTIALRVNEIVNTMKPKLIVIMWSHFSRRNIDGVNVPYDKNDFGNNQDLNNFIKNYTYVNNLPTTIIHSMVPGAFMGHLAEYVIKKAIDMNQIKHVEQLDWGRDYLHFDIKTSSMFVDWVHKKITNIDNTSKYPI
jgi:lysophospholipase L1-like esterase